MAMPGGFSEVPVIFEVRGVQCVGVLSLPDGQADVDVAVIVVVGGPQYRVGSHRQFVLLARDLAGAGIPVFRFDYRGMGDSDGVQQSFEHIDEDLRAVVKLVCKRVETNRVVLWGLCDGASAAMMYAPQDPSVIGIACANPWARSEGGLARARIKHYYVRRLVSKDFWAKFASGRFSMRSSIRDLLGFAAVAASPSKQTVGFNAVASNCSFLDRMERGWTQFGGRTLLLLSNQDLTAQEFRDWANQSRQRRALLSNQRIEVREHPSADHTFSSAEWRRWVQDATKQWIKSLRRS